jgi:hypothetical protein
LKPDPDLQAFGKQLDAVIATYIKGATSFDTCVDALAALLRSRFPQPSKPLPKGSSGSPATLFIPAVFAVGQEFAGADPEKANAAVRAAFARLFPFTDGAA